MGPILGQETKILEAGWLGKKKKKKELRILGLRWENVASNLLLLVIYLA